MKITAFLFFLLFLVACIPFPHGEKFIRHRVVKISAPMGMCSGEQIQAPSGANYILTAGHCKGLQRDGSMLITKEDGSQIWRRILAEDDRSDLLLLEGLPGVKGLDIADRNYGAEHVRTFTHGHDLPTYKTEGELIQELEVTVFLGTIDSPEQAAACSQPKQKIIKGAPPFDFISMCVLSTNEMISTALIVPGSSGGPVVDDSGELVGVASASDGTFSYFVSLSDIHKFLAAY